MKRLALLLALVAATAGGSVARAGCSATNEWQDAGPRWSPDGTRIAFYRVLPGCNPAPVGIYVVPAAGGSARLLGMTNGQWPPSWSADGNLVAFGGRRGIVLQRAVGQGLDEVTRGPDFAAVWSPDSAWIAFRRGAFAASELWIVRPNGLEPRRLSALRLHDHALPAWSPDSREIAFAAYDGPSVDIHIVDVHTGAVRIVAPSPAHDLDPSWSRNGDSLAFTSERDGRPMVYAADPRGARVVPWIEGRHAAHARYSFALAYNREDGIWYETGPMGPTRAVSRPDVLGRIDWRPEEADNPDFAFSAGGRCLRYGIYVVADGVEHRLTNPCEFRGRGLVRGTPFADFVYGSAGPDRLLGLGRKDFIDGGAGDDVLDGDGGWDRLLGGAGADLLIGRGDPDTLVGGPGRDRILAGKERDTIFARDGWRDMIDCGAGSDTVYADRSDVIARNCERVYR